MSSRASLFPSRRLPRAASVSCAAFAGAVLATALSTAPVAAAGLPSLSEARDVNDHTVGIVFHYEDVYRRLIEDMTEEFAKTTDVRVVPIIGANHVQTIYDMLYMQGVDLGVVHSDVLEYMAREQGYERVYQRISSLVELFAEKVAIIAGEDFRSLEDLAGQKVNFRAEGKGSDVTGTILFDTLGIDVEKTRFDKLEALEKVKSGEIAAMVYLIEEPVEAFSGLSAEDGVRLLELPQDEALLEHYRAAELTTEEFPELIDGEGTVPSLEVPVIVAAYNWPASETWRYEKVENFVDALLDGMDALREGESAERWRNASIDDDVPGVERLAMVGAIVEERETLARQEAEAAAAARAAELRAEQEALMERLTARLESGAGNPDELVELERLLEQMETILDE